MKFVKLRQSIPNAKSNLPFVLKRDLLSLFGAFGKSQYFINWVITFSEGYINKLFLISNLFFISSLYSETIPIILPYNNPHVQRLAAGFQKSFPYSTKTFYLKVQTEEEDSLLINDIRNLSPPIIVAVGDDSASRVRKYIKNIPVVVTMGNSLRNLEPEKSNLCGIEMNQQMIEYFKIIKQLNPEAKKIYALYSTEKTEQILDKGISEDIYHGLVLIKKKVTEKENFIKDVNSLPKDVDVFLILNDPIYDEKNFLYLSNLSKENKIILIAPYPSLVKFGATLTLYPDYKHLGVVTADFATKIISKETECQIGPFQKFQNFLLDLNFTYANESGINVPDSLKRRIQSDKLLMAGISLIDKNMPKSAQNIFTKIVNEDPNNELAKYYQNQILHEQTSVDIEKLIKKGEEEFSKKNYDGAKKAYREILSKNPNHKEAEKKYSECLKKESEILTQEAAKLDKSGSPFLAIKKLRGAIQLYPTNQEAIGLQNSIRSRELKEIDKHLQEAIQYYNDREYSYTIAKTENILLIDQTNKTANEYLRLSKIKLTAYKKLEDCMKKTNENQDCKLLK